jgi:hypothetical protein
MSLDLNIARRLDTTATRLSYISDKIQFHKTLPAIVLGGLGGWLTGVGPKLGVFQAVASSLQHSCVIRPMAKYINKYIGTGDDKKIHPQIADRLAIAFLIMEIVGPIFITLYFGPSVDSTADYTFFRGMLCSLAPVVTQFGIEYWRDENNNRVYKI